MIRRGDAPSGAAALLTMDLTRLTPNITYTNPAPNWAPIFFLPPPGRTNSVKTRTNSWIFTYFHVRDGPHLIALFQRQIVLGPDKYVRDPEKGLFGDGGIGAPPHHHIQPPLPPKKLVAPLHPLPAQQKNRSDRSIPELVGATGLATGSTVAPSHSPPAQQKN